MSCIFCEIVAGERDAWRIFDEPEAVAFLDRRPLFAGHVLVVPRAHHETLVDLPPELVEPLFSKVRRLAAVVRDTLGAQGTFVAMNNRVSQSVPHLHVHVVPRTKGDGLRGFFWPRTKVDDDEMARVARALRDAWAH